MGMHGLHQIFSRVGEPNSVSVTSSINYLRTEFEKETQRSLLFYFGGMSIFIFLCWFVAAAFLRFSCFLLVFPANRPKRRLQLATASST